MYLVVLCRLPFAGMAQSASSSSSKRIRIERLGREGARVSQRGIANILSIVKEHGLPESFSCASQYRARKRACQEPTPFGPLVQDLEIGGVTVSTQHPVAMLWKVSASATFQRLLRRAQLEGDFIIILYSDGISPQDGLSKHDKRKVVAIYWSILAFDDALYEETVWFCITVIRVSELLQIGGGLSRVIRDLLRLAFFSATGNLQSGVELQYGLIVKAAEVLVHGDIPAISDPRLLSLSHKCLLAFPSQTD